MSKAKGINTSGNAVAKKNKKDKTSEEHLAASMKDVKKILDLNAAGKDTMEIASKVRVGASYVAEVVSKGAETMEAELRAGYGMPPKETGDTSTATQDGVAPETTGTNEPAMLDSATETKEQKKARIKAEKEAAKAKKDEEKAAAKAAKEADKASAEPKQPKEKRTRENAILQAIGEGKGTVDEIGTRAREILGIDRKSWTGTLGAMKRAGEITYDKESKTYKLPAA